MVALDACDERVMRALAAEGRAPTIAALLGRAALVGTSAPVGVYEGAIWPTLFTALSTSKHGYYCHEELTLGTYDHRATRSTRDHGDSLLAGAQRSREARRGDRRAPFGGVGAGQRDSGRRVRMSRPTRRFQHVAAGARAGHSSSGSACIRSAASMRTRRGSSRRATSRTAAGGPRRTHDEARALFAELVAGQEAKAKLSLDLLDQGDWDLFVTVLGEGHCTGHQFWALHDPSEPAHDPELAAELGDPVLEMYSRLDRALGEHLERAGPDTSVFVLMSHGMGQMNSGVFLIDAVLRRLAEAETRAPAVAVRCAG